MSYISIIGISVSLLLTLIGAFFAYRCWMQWRHTHITGIGAEVTKDRAFLSNNFKLVLVIGALNGVRVIFEAAERLDLLSPPWLWNAFDFLYYLNTITIMSALLILSISWHKVLTKVNRWDKHWIKAK
ncbi:MAG: hypothetical protein Q7U60_08520 [Candidatus Methanoperedens sp.]|nr:hypothetical protein [Candidatus Methanoperedens sp.]